MGEPEGDLSNSEEKLHVTEEERDKAVGELKVMKTLVQEANLSLSAALTTQPDISAELDAIKKALSNAKQELKNQEKKMASLKSEAERAKQLEVKLAEKDALLDKLREEIDSLKRSNRTCSLEDCKGTRIHDLEEELEKRNESEMELLDSLVTKTKELEETKISLEESKLVISSLSEKMEKGSFAEGHGGDVTMLPIDDDEEVEKLRYELQLVKESLVHAEESERVASMKVQSLVEELNTVKNELKMVTEVEEHGKNAMDELAFALKEVATEANDVKDQLAITKRELEKSRSEAAQSRFLLKSMENRCRTLLEEARKEVEKHRNISERLRLEAEESQLAWHEKETMFVQCIKDAEEENLDLQKENDRLIDALTDSKNKISTSKEENKKLRDILKQAINEANVAKEAAAIAREENSQLKDSAAEKENALEILSQEIENLRMKEASLNENIKELKTMLRQAELSQYGFKTMDTDQVWRLNAQHSIEKEHKDVNNSTTSERESNLKKLGRNCSLDFNSVRPAMNNDHDGKRNDSLKGSIFDTASPAGHGASPNRKKSLSLSFAEDPSLNAEAFQQQEKGQEDEEGESDKNARKRKPALFKRFGTMLIRRSFQR